MLVPMIRETPVAIEKNATREEKSRMRGRGLEAHYRISRTLQGERNSPLQGWLDLKTYTNNQLSRGLITRSLPWWSNGLNGLKNQFTVAFMPPHK